MAAPTEWRANLRTLCEEASKNGISDEFKKCSTNAECVWYILDNSDLRAKLTSWLEKFSFTDRSKYAERANSYRNQGNRLYHQNNDAAALDAYTKSVLLAPRMSESATDQKNCLALAYANRSAALYHLEKFKSCISDIDRALQTAYPSELQYKLYHRKGMCLFNLGKTDEAEVCLKKALEHLANAILPEGRKDDMRESITNILWKCTELYDDVKPKVVIELPFTLPPLLEGGNPAVEGISSALELKKDEIMGRHIVASNAIPAGSTILVEKAYASVLLPSYYETHCHHCYTSPIEAAVPCRQCSQVRYCSDRCADESWTRYHKYECLRLDVLHEVGVVHLAFRVLLVTGIPKILGLKEKLDKPCSPSGVEGANERDEYLHSYYCVYHLITHDKAIDWENRYSHALTAALVLLLFESQSIEGDSACALDRIQNELIPASERGFLGALIMHHAEQLICNAHAITQVVETEGKLANIEQTPYETCEEVRIATAIYPSASLLNHSCDPNIINSFHKDWLIARTAKDVETGEQIYNCYGPHCKRMNYHERQAVLKDQYRFECCCSACKGKKDMEFFSAFKCQRCEGPVLVNDDKGPNAMCRECGKTQDATQLVKKSLDSDKFFKEALDLMDKAKYGDATRNLRECLCLRQEVLYRDNKELGLAWDQMARCHALMGNFAKAHHCLKESVSITKQIHGSESIEYANELQKMSDVLVQLVLCTELKGQKGKPSQASERLVEAISTVDEGIRVFTRLYGDWHESTRQLIEKRRNLAGVEQILASVGDK